MRKRHVCSISSSSPFPSLLLYSSSLLAIFPILYYTLYYENKQVVVVKNKRKTKEKRKPCESEKYDYSIKDQLPLFYDCKEHREKKDYFRDFTFL